MSDGKSGGKLWGGRFAGSLDPFFAEVNQSLPVDQRMAGEDVIGSMAWAEGLARAKVLTDDEKDEIHRGLEAVLDELPRVLAKGPDDEDIHSLVERLLTEKVGPLAKKLHTGRSRNDQVATDLKLHLRSAVSALLDGVLALQGALVEIADGHAGAPIPGYTHLQRAQPVTIGHWALAYVEMLARDAERFDGALERMGTCPLGAAALAGTAFPIDRDHLAEILGFGKGPTRNSLDTVSDRDHACELAFACSLTMIHLSRLAEDTILFCSQETGFARFGDLVSTGSSLMPQKRNPDAMELVRGKAGRVCGALQALLMTLKGLPLAYNKDMQEDKEALFDVVENTIACLRIAATAIGDLTFDLERCEAAASTGYMDATDLADLLVRAGVPFREAHDRVGATVNAAIELGVELRDLPEAAQQELLPELVAAGVDLGRELAVDSILTRREAVGGTSPIQVFREVQRWRGALDRRATALAERFGSGDADGGPDA